MEAEGSAPAGPSGSGGVRSDGEAGRGVAGGSAQIASVSSPAKDDVKAFNLEKFSGEDWASRSFRMELLFNHYGLLEVMDGELKRPASEGATKEWDRRSKDGFFLLSQCLSSNQLHHVKHLIKDIHCGPKAWKILKDVHAPSSEAMVVVLERQLHAVKINEGDVVQGAFDQLRALYVKLSAAGVDYPEKIKCYKALSLLPESWGPLVVNLNGMKDSWSLEWIRAQVLQEEFRRKKLTAAAGEVGGSAYGMKGFKGRGSKKGKAKEGFGGEQYSGGMRSNKGGKRCGGKCWYCHVEGHLWFKCRKLADGWRPGQPSIEGSKGVHRAMGEGMGSEEGDGGAGGHGGMFYHVGEACSEDMVVPASKVALHRSSHLVINTGSFMTMTNREDLLDEVRPSKVATVVFSDRPSCTQMMGTKVFKATLDGRVLWDLRGGKDMHRSMWEIPVLPWKEAAVRVAAEAVRGGHASHVTSGGVGDGSDGGLLVLGGGCATKSEFRSWLKRHGIKQQLTTAYTPQSNGVAERANRTIIEGGRTILVDSGLPLRFCPLTIRHATVIKNWVLTHVGGQHWVPMEKWSGKKPLVDMLRVFGCMGLVHVPREKRDKLQAAAVWAVHLGLAWGSKGWLMWDPKSNTIFTTRDAKFMEGLMFKEWLEWGRSKFTIPIGIEVGTNDPLLIPIELSSSSELTEVSHDLGGAEGEAADVEKVLQQGQAPVAERGDTEEEVQQPTPSPKLPSRLTTQGKRDAVRGGAKEGESKERPKRAAHPREFLKYERLGVPKALLVQEEEDEEEKVAQGEMEQICCFGVMSRRQWRKLSLEMIERHGWLQGRMNAKGRLERRKTRLVVKGFQQREGIDFQQVFVPVAKASTLRLLLAAAAVCGWKVEQMDVKTAFLYGVVDEEIYMKQLEGYDDGSGRVCRLNKAIYGLKKAPRCWYARLVEALEALGFKVSGCNQSLFMTEGEEEKVFLLVYVDDILLFSPSLERIKEVQGKLKETFQCKALGPVGYYLGLHVEQDEVKGWLRLHHYKYLAAIGEKYGLEEGRSVKTPLPSRLQLHLDEDECEVLEYELQRRFQSMVGSLMYASVNTRTDIAF
ncbi:unnamed protein product [Closterium sp. NIES-53]